MENDIMINLNTQEGQKLFFTETEISALFNLLKEELIIRQQLILTTLPLAMPDLTTTNRVMPILAKVGTKYNIEPYQGQQGIQGYLEWLYKKTKKSSDFKDVIRSILGTLEGLLPLLEQCRYFYSQAYHAHTNVLSNEDIEYLNVNVGIYLGLVQRAIALTVDNLSTGMLTRRNHNLKIKNYNEIYNYISEHQDAIQASLELSTQIEINEDECIPQVDLEEAYKDKLNQSNKG